MFAMRSDANGTSDGKSDRIGNNRSVTNATGRTPAAMPLSQHEDSDLSGPSP